MTTKMIQTVTIIATHENGTTIRLTRRPGSDCSRTYDLLRQSGYIRIEVR